MKDISAFEKISPEHVYRYAAGKLSPFVQRAFDDRCRKRIQNKDFSIICPTCIGGAIYHRLGMQFDSPTVNMFFKQKEFIQMCRNLCECMQLELEFLNTDYDYPVGRLNFGEGIICHFNHYKTEDEAREAWNRRRTRIHYDNLYVIVYDRDMDGLSREDILALTDIPCKRLVVLSDHQYPDIPYVKTMHKPKKHRPNDHAYMDHDEWDFMTFEKQFDFVAWLNGQERF